MEENISGVEDTIQEIHKLSKENVVSKKCLTQTTKEIWDTSKILNIKLIRLQEKEESQLD